MQNHRIPDNHTHRRPQLKICGLTRAAEARVCAALGADAIGLVFYAPSPRHVSLTQARSITRALPAAVSSVGVFVDANFERIMATADACGLTAVQLHGSEAPDLVMRLCRTGLTVIKALFADRSPHFDDAADYAPHAFLVECVRGPLPGGNAMAWNWSQAREFDLGAPLILAGGITPRNIAAAVAAARPDGVDVSSGVEKQPGVKDLARVKALMAALAEISLHNQPRRIFS